MNHPDLLAALTQHAGPLDYAAPSARLVALAERWALHARQACAHAGPFVANVSEHPVWCLVCALARGHLARWLAGTACPSCGRYTAEDHAGVAVLALDDHLTLLATLCDACTTETETT